MLKSDHGWHHSSEIKPNNQRTRNILMTIGHVINTFTDPLSTVLESQQVQTELAGFRRKDRIICSEGSDIQDRR